MRTIKIILVVICFASIASSVYGQAGAIAKYGAKTMIKAEVKQAVKQQVKAIVRKDLRTSVRSSTRTTVRRDLSQVLRNDVKNNIKSDIIKQYEKRTLLNGSISRVADEIKDDARDFLYEKTVSNYYSGQLAKDIKNGFRGINPAHDNISKASYTEESQMPIIELIDTCLTVAELKRLGEKYETDEVEGDASKAFYYYYKAAKANDAYSQNKIGNMYMEGKGCTKNEYDAVIWYRKAAEQGNKYAQNNLGFCYIDGKGVKRNREEGLKWIRMSAAQGYEPAETFLKKNGYAANESVK